MDEVDFVNAAQGGADNTMIYMRLGPVPILLMPYLGALKAWVFLSKRSFKYSGTERALEP